MMLINAFISRMAILNLQHVNVRTIVKNRLISKFPQMRMWTVLNYLNRTCTKQGGAINLVHVSLYSNKSAMFTLTFIKCYNIKLQKIYVYLIETEWFCSSHFQLLIIIIMVYDRMPYAGIAPN